MREANTMHRNPGTFSKLLLCLSFVLLVAATAHGEDPADAPGHAAANEPTLAARQEMIAARFVRFQKTLLQMAEYMRKTDPDRADLLIRAVGRSNTAGAVAQMKAIVGLLDRSEPVFGDAIDNQEDVIKTLHSLLELLQSEDRRNELEKEAERIQAILKKIGKLIGIEKDIRAATERREDVERLAADQEKLQEQAEDVVDKMDAHDGKKPSETDKSKQNDSQQDAETKDTGEKSENTDEKKTSDEQQKEQTESDDKDSSKKTPGRDEVEQARREMKRAAEELKQKDHDKASTHQDEAIAKLREAKEQLEETLRQLREEERKMFLATMEARFQKMMAMQLLVYNATLQLGKVESDDWSGRHTSQSIKLARDEEAIVAEAGKALTLLQAEGTSVAFPEAIEQLRDDMLTIVHLLERSEVGNLTQQIEREIIEALEEMIEAFQKELEDSEEESEPSEQQQGEPGETGLVDALAELRMLRSLQVRINRRTKTIGDEITGEQATDAIFVDQLQELAKRQARIQRATYDLAIGRNR
jgi:hypothetical protein